MKAIIIVVQPQHISNILNGYKTLEIRTTCPKEWKDYLSGKTKVKPEPEKVYIYCTKGNKKNRTLWKAWNYYYCDDRNHNAFDKVQNGKVVAEFTLNEVEEFNVFENGSVQYWNNYDLEKSCLTYEQIADYIGNGKTGYAWHIDDLKIYDVPKELGEFYRLYDYKNSFSILRLTRPFADWGYCEELEEV